MPTQTKARSPAAQRTAPTRVEESSSKAIVNATVLDLYGSGRAVKPGETQIYNETR